MKLSGVLSMACCTFGFGMQAAVFHIDPASGSMQNDGSASAPWSTLAEVLDAELIATRSYSPLPYEAGVSQLVPKNPGAPVQAGDTLLLFSGLHGDCFYRGAYNTAVITIMAADGETPVLSQFHMQACANWRLIGVQVSPEPYGVFHGEPLVRFASHGYHGPTRDVEVRDCNVSTAADTWEWTAAEWVDRASDGIRVSGNHAAILNNELTNVHFGIVLAGDSGQAVGNSIVNFSGDGMRPMGSDILFEGNTIKNCYAVGDGNHDDGIQSFTNLANPFYRVTLRGNTIINNEDPDQPLMGAMQGIGLFDGPFIDWVVENNVVLVDHWHGISLYGAQDCRVVNNTVIDPSPDTGPGPSWIMINDIDGFPSSGCVVANNIANTFNITDAVMSANLSVSGADYALHFVDATAHDVHLIAGSAAIDAADDAYAPATDRDGNPRPFGAQSDIGAYEHIGSTGITPVGDRSIAVFPNPASTELTVTLPGSRGRAVLEVIASDGRLVKSVAVAGGPATIDIRGLAAGHYTCRVRDPGTVLGIGSFIKD